MTKETINDFYARLKYYTPEAPTVKKELHPDFVVEKGMQENLIHCILHARRLLTLEEYFEAFSGFGMQRAVVLQFYFRVEQHDGGGVTVCTFRA